MELEDLEKYSKPYNLNEENSSNSNLEEIYELYNKYLKSRTSKFTTKMTLKQYLMK